MKRWACVHTIATYFKWFQKCVPWIALVLLLFIGGKMLVEGFRRLHHCGLWFCYGTGMLHNNRWRHLGSLSWGNCDREKTGNKARGQSRYFGRHYFDSDWCRNFCKRSILLRLLLKFKNLSKKLLTFLK